MPGTRGRCSIGLEVREVTRVWAGRVGSAMPLPEGQGPVGPWQGSDDDGRPRQAPPPGGAQHRRQHGTPQPRPGAPIVTAGRREHVVSGQDAGDEAEPRHPPVLQPIAEHDPRVLSPCRVIRLQPSPELLLIRELDDRARTPQSRAAGRGDVLDDARLADERRQPGHIRHVSRIPTRVQQGAQPPIETPIRRIDS